MISKLAGVATLVAFLMTGVGTTSASAEDTRILDFPAGFACTFAVRIEVTGSNLVNREFLDKNGDLGRILLAGTGPAYTFTNAETGQRLSTPARGSTRTVTVNPDGTETRVLTGHDLLILFQSDFPAGPSTTLYNGRVVFTVDAIGTFRLQDISGRSTDVCAAIS